MSTFFINRPIVAMVISIIMVIVGAVAALSLPVAQFPNIAPPEIFVNTTYTGASALTVEQSVAAPIEQQISGVQDMTYMYSLSANNGQLRLYVDFDVTTDANTDQILTQMRVNQANSQVPADVRNFGITVQQSVTAPLMIFALYSPNGTYDNVFLANYATINLNNPLLRVEGIGQVQVFGAGQYAMRMWVKPDQLAKLGITVPEIVSAIEAQNTVNPAGQVGGEPIPAGQEFTYAIQAQGRLVTAEQFGEIVIRAEADGAVVRVRDVARIELGAQNYSMVSRMNGKPAALLAIYQLPGSNALATAAGARKLMEEAKKHFPEDLDYVTSLDTTLAVTAGMHEIVKTLYEALILVIIVVYVFLQGWRATLIPLLAVPVSLVGTFIVFPMLGFSINTLSLFGLVLAIGLVVDDAIVVVEAVEHHIEEGLAPKEATLKAMSEVQGPVVAIAIILAAVFIPTAFIPGITGRLYQQFAVTIAVSVIISAFNALTLSPALSAMLLRPRKESRGPLGLFFKGFNWVFGGVTRGYVGGVHGLIKVALLTTMALFAIAGGGGWIGSKLPTGFLPDEDQGYMYGALQLPNASSLQRTDEVAREVEQRIMNTPGVRYCSTVTGFSLLSLVNTTYNAFFFITFEPWDQRTAPEQQYQAIKQRINEELRAVPGGIAFGFPPPAIPGVGTAGGFTFILQDRGGNDVEYLRENTEKFMAAARKRPELEGVNSAAILSVPQVFANVDRDKALKQGVPLKELYTTLQAFMGGLFINYFNRFGYQWQVYLQAEGEYRRESGQMDNFFVRNETGQMVPLGALVTMEEVFGPEFTMRYNLFRSVQINGNAAPGFSSAQAMKALEETFAETMPGDMGYGWFGMSYQEFKAATGVPASAIFGLSVLFVFLILAALYESWALPFSVLLSVPIAVTGAFLFLWYRGLDNNVYAQIGMVMLIGLSAKNAILIVEFTRAEFLKGRPLVDATLAGAKLRLRPILMTSFAFVLGCVPLAIAEGAGAISRQVLGTIVIGGMLASTLIAVFIIPVNFYVVEWLSHWGKPDAHAKVAAEGAVDAGGEPGHGDGGETSHGGGH
ncbi:MAG: multidrug efflux RND transporter permease subunit [Phycisphaerales bacterium]